MWKIRYGKMRMIWTEPYLLSSLTQKLLLSKELVDKKMEMELDMGAEASVVSYADYNKYFKHLP